MLYQPGDRVVIRVDLCEQSYYMADGEDSNYAVSEMVEMAGQIVTIARISGAEYRILEDEEEWSWTDGMFSGLADETPDDLEIDDTELLSFLSAYQTQL